MVNLVPLESRLSSQKAQSGCSEAAACGMALQSQLGPAPVERQEEVVHGAEVVVHQLGFQAGGGGDPPRGHGGVALFEHESLGGVEEGGPGLRTSPRRGADRRHRWFGPGGRRWRVPFRLRRAQMYIPPLTPITCPVT